MALPEVELPTSEHDGINFHSLSRTQVLELAKYREVAEEAEKLILQWATDSTSEEVDRFREHSTVKQVSDLLDAILAFSGLTTTELETEDGEKKE